MNWRKFFTGTSAPKRAVKASSIDPSTVNAMPTDPTLDSAAQEISQSIKEKAGHIAVLADEIREMTENFLREYKGKDDAPKD